MSQQARSILDLSLVATTAIAYARCVNIVAPTVTGALAGAQATTQGQKILGIARRAAAAGEMVDVTVLGTAVCEAGAAIAVGARVMCDASGRVITASVLAAAATGLSIAAGGTAVTSTAANGAIVSGNATLSGGDTPLFVFGTALQAAAAAGDLIEVVIGN